MFRLLVYALAWAPICFAADAFISEPLQPLTTNKMYLMTASSNWLVLGTIEPAAQPGTLNQQVLYARCVPADGRPYERIAVNSSLGVFGGPTTVVGDTLVAKDDIDTYFFRDIDGTWTPDGKIAGDNRSGAQGGPLVLSNDFLISGSEVYQWPSRTYLQTFTLHLLSATFAGVKLAVTRQPLGK